ncbi:hypothetical protein ACHAWX_004984 [Stephanocyclus meneghinianus]
MCSGNVSMPSQMVDRDRKRKVSSHTHELYQNIIIPPRFTSAKILRISPPSPSRSEWQSASFEFIPQEIFCTIVAYLGPTSTSLCVLSQISRSHNAIMKTIGDVMLPEAKTRFRVPLAPMADCESSISLFVRHARAAKEVHDYLNVLEKTLAKDFSTFDSSKDDALSNSDNTVTRCEVDQALDIALCLLDLNQRYCHLSYQSNVKLFNSASKIAASAATTALEWKVSKLCALIGAKAYKYAKAMFCDSEEDFFTTPYQVTDEYHDGEDDTSLGSDHSDDEYVLLDKACAVMQLTVSRDIEIARQIQQASGSVPSRSKLSVL